MPINPKPKCELLPESRRYARKEIVSVVFEDYDLLIEFETPDGILGRITFHQPIGFRVLDESGLCEFWPEYSEPNGWLYEVLEGGWLDLERTRAGFWTIQAGLREFLVCGNECVNVMTGFPPTIEELDANPQQP